MLRWTPRRRVPGRGGMFLLEGPLGLRFLTRSRLFTDEKWEVLSAAEPPGTGPSSAARIA